ncbi:MAG TPA: AI-2E family transporter [Mesorhizobium sp.]
MNARGRADTTPHYAVATGRGSDNEVPLGGVSLPPLLTLAGTTAILYLAKDILLPIAVALLLTFALAPIVSALRRRSVPRIFAVILTVSITFLGIALFSFVVGTQLTNVAREIPSYQYNIIEKIRSLRDVGADGGLIDRLTGAVERVGREISQGTTAPKPGVAGSATPTAQPKPLPVEIIERSGPIEMVRNVVLPLISPFATAGLVVVVVIFMLLEREALRDRFIRLAGYSDLHRTTEALQDAGSRVGRYLLMQLVVNTAYAVPISLGLWLLGTPNAILWGMLTLVLRFVPYIGPAIGMVLPLVVTFAVTPGWAPLLWTAALFLAVELISNNVLEPWLYGSRTGLSPLAIIVSAIFWAWLWGPLGLVLSTPLTVCLVVLGRHVPQFEFFNVLFGNEPVLEPDARLYQRLLAGDPDEGADHAEEFLEQGYLVDFYEQVGIPALLLGEQDRQRGVMTSERLRGFAAAARDLVADLQEVADEEEEEEDMPASRDPKDKSAASHHPGTELPEGDGKRLLCVGGRGELDDAASAMLAQVLEVQGATAAQATHAMIELGKLADLSLADVDTVIVTYLNPASVAQARHAVRRLKRRKADLRVGLLVPNVHGSSIIESAMTAEKLNADFVAGTLSEAVRAGFADDKAVRLKMARKRLSSVRSTKAKATKVAA